MLNFSSLRDQAETWKNRFRQQQSGGWLKRIVAWLLLGVLLLVGMAVMLLLLLVSWLLIPILVYRYRQQMKAFRQAAEARFETPTETSESGIIYEGEVISREER